ncbi:MAG: transglutaminase-like domain-containing protein [Flavobacteriales bacterium]
MKKLKSIGIGAAIVFAAFFICPFLLAAVSKKASDHIYRAISLNLIAHQLKTGNKSEKELALSIYDYVRSAIKHPDAGQKILEMHPVEVLKMGRGSCDQMAHLMIFISWAGGLDGRMVFLFGSENISRHTVAELMVDGKWAMFDPYYQHIAVDEGRLLSVDEIVRQTFAFGDNPLIDSLTYNSYFDKKFPSKVHPLDRETKREKVMHFYLDMVYDMSPLWFSRMLQSFANR